MFAIAVGTSPATADVSAVLFTPPTISICRGVQQRNKATKKLGYMNPDEMYAAVASRGGEAYKTKAGSGSKRTSVSGATHLASVDAGPSSKHGVGSSADSAMKNAESSGKNAKSDRNQQTGAMSDVGVTSGVNQKNGVISLSPKRFPRSVSAHIEQT
jgi:hypothetical protein